MKNTVIYCTCPDQNTASNIARHLVEKDLSTCVNIIPNITSTYRWQGKVECAQECLLLIKAKDNLYQAIEDAIISRHPYELPEIIAVPIANGLPEYLRWLNGEKNPA